MTANVILPDSVIDWQYGYERLRNDELRIKSWLYCQLVASPVATPRASLIAQYPQTDS